MSHLTEASLPGSRPFVGRVCDALTLAVSSLRVRGGPKEALSGRIPARGGGGRQPGTR